MNKRRFKIFEIADTDWLAMFRLPKGLSPGDQVSVPRFELPEDARVVAVMPEFASDSFLVKVESKEFPAIEPGMLAPRIDLKRVVLRGETIRVDDAL